MAVVLAVRRAALGSQSFCRYGQGKVLVARRSFSPMAWYNAQLQKAPVLTKSITSGGEAILYDNEGIPYKCMHNCPHPSAICTLLKIAFADNYIAYPQCLMAASIDHAIRRRKAMHV